MSSWARGRRSDDIMPSPVILDRWGNFYMHRDPDEEWSEDEKWKLQAAYRWRDIEKALKEEDIDALTRLIIHVEDWIKYVLEKLMRGPGRARGEPRPGDLPDHIRMYLRYAAIDVIRIRDIWEWRLGWHNRGEKKPPTPFDIAARRWEVTVDQLTNYVKTPRRRRLKY